MNADERRHLERLREIHRQRLMVLEEQAARLGLADRVIFAGSRPDVVVCCNQRGVRLGVMAARLAGSGPVVYRNGRHHGPK